MSTQPALGGPEREDVRFQSHRPRTGPERALDSMEAGEPTLGTAVLRGGCSLGPGRSGWDSASLPSCLGRPRAATSVPRGNALLSAVGFEFVLVPARF